MEHNVIGLKVTDGTVTVVDLHDWITSRDAACAEYLAPALRQYMDDGPCDVED